MDKRDVFIVLAGGVLLVAATALAGVRGDASADYQLTYTPTTMEGLRADTPSGPAPTAGLLVAHPQRAEGNVTLARFYLNVTSSASFARGASARLEVQLPNGTIVTKEATAAAGATELRLALEVPVALMPQGTVARAATASDAARLLARSDGGDWNSTVRVATGDGLVPFSTTFASAFDGWVGRVAPAVAATR